MNESGSPAKLLEKVLAAAAWKNFALPLAVIAAAVVMRGFIFESLWLDELLSYWVAKDSFKDLVHRSAAFLGLSPFPHLVPWLILRTGNSAEWYLRVAPMIFTVLSSAVLYRIARKFLRSDAAILSVISLIVLDQVLVSAMSFRPYAQALLFALLSIWFLLRWCEERKFYLSLLYATFTIFTVYSHYLFIGILAVHAAYVIALHKSLSKRFLIDAGFVFTLIVGATLPGVYQCLAFVRQHGDLSFRPMPHFRELVHALIPLYIILYLVTSFLLTFLLMGKVPCAFPARDRRPFLCMVIVWYLLGPLMLYAYSVMGGSSLFVGRYFLWSAPGMALVIGILVELLQTSAARRLTIAVFCLMAFIRESGRIWKIEDWSAIPEIVKEVSQEPPPYIALYSGLLENKRIEWLTDPERMPYLAAPLQYYRIPPAEDKSGLIEAVVQPIPPQFSTSAARAFFTNTLKPALAARKQFFFVCLDQQLVGEGERVEICKEHSVLFAELGYSGKMLRGNNLVQISVFNKK